MKVIIQPWETLAAVQIATGDILLFSDVTTVYPKNNIRAIVANFRDVTDRRGVEEALRENEELYRIATETATDGIITIDEHSRMLFINPAATEIFGYAADELLGLSITTLMPERLRHRHLSGLHRYLGSAQRTVPSRLTAHTRSHASSERLRKSERSPMPALLTSTSSRP